MYNVSNINDVISQYYEFYESIRWFVEKSFVDIPGSKHLHMYIQLYTFLLLHSKFIEFVENSNDPNISYEGKEFINNLMQLCSLRLSNSFINRSYVEKKIVQSKEKEKNRITNELFRLNDEERETYLMLKKHKLGRTGKGLSKSIFAYVGEDYVANRDLFVEAEDHENNDLSNLNEDYILEE